MKPLLHSTDDASRLNCVARRSHIGNMLTPRALPDGRLPGLCATRGFTTGSQAMRRLAQLGTSGPQRAGLLSVLVFLCLGTTTSYAQSSPFAGEWILEITQGSTVQTGLLAIEETDDGLVGFVENGPIALAIEGDRISMAIDSRNATGGALERHLEGVLTGTRMSGEFGPPADAPERGTPGLPTLPWGLCPSFRNLASEPLRRGTSRIHGSGARRPVRPLGRYIRERHAEVDLVSDACGTGLER